MITVKQPEGSKLCMAACCAMVAGTTLEEVLAETTLHADGYLSTREATIFLARRNLLLGAFFAFDREKWGEVPETVNFDYVIAAAPAVVTVQSDAFGGCNHAIVWDNEVQLFRDPNPKFGDKSFPIKYKIREWWPLTVISECC